MKPRFVGPFRVMKAVDANDFELALPDTMHIHPVYNVSLLHKYQGEYHPPGPIIVEYKEEYKVDCILWHRGNGKCRQYLIHWKSYVSSKDCCLKAYELLNAPFVL